MDTKGWQAAKDVFYEALERGPGEREALLAGVEPLVRQEVEALLQAHERAQQKADQAEPVRDGPGATIDRYKLLQEIGEGGFGVVYLAEQQEPVRRRVALKIIKIGMDTKQVIARFEAERQALAILDHPNIAKVLDAGTTETGRPYFVMELVKGIPITEYCDQAALDTRERLHLFTGVCRAIQHAHQKGIIHRDLKPGNVLVTLHDGTPVPKVIDFGIAKATDRHLTEKTLFTEFRQIVGTPEYMAPEQAAYSGLDVDTRADVYSLGVLLYELLTGSKPFEITSMMELGWGEILRVIREVDPPRPSTKLSTMGDDLAAVAKRRHTEPRLLGRLVKGDLDWIVMKALEKDRARRYDTADALAQDVDRYLGDLPVAATPPSAAYRLRKYVRRHKVGVTATAAVALALLAGFVLTTLGFVEARRQRTEAVAERDGADRARAAEAEARTAAETAALQASRERDEKETARVELAQALERAEGTRLLAQSQAALLRDPSLALLLAIAGAGRAPGFQANQALLAALRKAPAREVTLAGGICPVAEFGPRGERLATGHEDGCVRIWDVRTGRAIHELRLGDRQVVALRWVAARNRVVAVAEGGTIGAWDATSGERLVEIEGQPGDREDPMGFLSRISTDGSRAVLIWGRHEVEVFDLDESEFPRTLALDGQSHAAVSEDGRLLLAVAHREDGPLRSDVVLHDLDAGTVRHTWPRVQLNPQPRFSPDGARVLIAVGEGESRLFDAATGEGIRGFRIPEGPHRGGTIDHGFSPDGRRVFSTDGAHVWVWDVASGRRLLEVAEPVQSMTLRFSSGGERLTLVSRAEQTVAKVYCVDTGAVLWEMPTDELTHAVEVSPDGRRIVAFGWRRAATLWDAGSDPLRLRGTWGNRIVPVGPQGRFWVNAILSGSTPPRIWDLETRRPIRHLDDQRMLLGDREGTMHGVPAVAASADGTRIVCGGMYGGLTLWDATTGRQLRSWAGHEGPVWSAAFSADGTRILTCGQDETARLWDAVSGAPIATLGEVRPFGEDVEVATWQINGRWASFGPQGERILTRLAEEDGIQVWDARTGECVVRVTDYEGIVIGSRFAADGQLLVSTTRTPPNTVETWIHDARTGALRHRFAGCSTLNDGCGVSGAAGREVLVCVEGQGVVVHDVESGEQLRTLPFEGGALLGAWFGPEDRHVAARTDTGNRLVVWDAASGAVVFDQPYGGGLGLAPTAPFLPDGSHVIGCTARGYELLPLDPLPLARSRAPRALTPAECRRYGLPSEADATLVRPIAPTPEEEAAWSVEDRMAARLRKLVEPVLTDGEALEDAERSLRTRVRDVGLPEVALSQTLELLGDRASEDLAWERAEHVHRVAYEHARRAFGDDNPTTEWALRRHAGALTRAGRPAEAEPRWRGLILRWQGRVEDPYRGRLLTGLGACLLAQERYAEAEAPLQEGFRHNTGHCGAEHWATLEARSLLGACLAALGRVEEAEPHLRDAFLEMRPWPGRTHLAVEALVRVVDFYEAQGKPEEAEAWRARATPEAPAKLGWPAADDASE